MSRIPHVCFIDAFAAALGKAVVLIPAGGGGVAEAAGAAGALGAACELIPPGAIGMLDSVVLLGKTPLFGGSCTCIVWFNRRGAPGADKFCGDVFGKRIGRVAAGTCRGGALGLPGGLGLPPCDEEIFSFDESSAEDFSSGLGGSSGISAAPVDAQHLGSIQAQ